MTTHACVLIDYDTGQTKLRPASNEATALASTVVQLDDATPSPTCAPPSS
ncbi:hypothetical protein [Streptomyces sp. NPDC054765]